MPKFRKKPVVIEANQWFRNGDHPKDYRNEKSKKEKWEGLIVRRYSHPDISPSIICKQCNKMMVDHGWIDTLEGGHIVCPGDWIITGVRGENYPCKPDIFKKTYEKVGGIV